jgi:hypothetical membrane protein
MGDKLIAKLRTIATDKTWAAPVLWISSVQYFVAQLIVIAAWPVPHSWQQNYISDLGNTACGAYENVAVCSPLHPLMNISFAIFGLTIFVGSILFYAQFERTRLSAVSFSLMALSGVGSVLVGAFPENTISELHFIGAFLGLVIGNVAIVLLAFALKKLHIAFRLYSAASGVVALIAFGLFYSQNYLGVGVGGMERVVSYSFTTWMVVFGIYMVRARRY